MTSSSDSFDSKGSSRNMIQVFTQIANILEKYKDHYDKKLNFTELLKQLEIPISKRDELISCILKFQQIFNQLILKKKSNLMIK